MTVTELPGLSAPAAGPIITEPGIYDLTNAEYHADPVPGGSLSSTGARRLLAPSCPALFQHERTHGQKSRKVFDFGSAAHMTVLGAGPELVRIDADEWRTNAVKAQVAEVRERGAIPLKPAEWAQVHAMADAIRRHPVASRLFAPGSGQPEQSLFWVDQATGVWRRCRPDWLPYPTGGRLIVPDYKTCLSADPRSIERAVYDHGYYQQDPWYVDGIRAVLGVEDVVMVFVFQEKTAPYLIHIVQLDLVAIRAGRRRNREALAIYQQCTAAGQWPGYSDRVEIVSLPAWAEKQESAK
ncbi:PD-(D/E)XK nuclease-like domain-containing protein [Kitasatospora sp. NPDC101235]|uniref:PD-(D/E)XK nuclease-like domain-containing protein n=1 Tax=Kitasatospora sp. NPDC101235 TaxID=3364101 RepID=UPI00381E3967